MGVLLVVFRCVLAGVFVAAAVGKLLDLAGSARAMADFGVPHRLARPAALVLPFVELCAAWLLLADRTARYGAVLATLLLLCFSVGIMRALAQGRAPDCHCFGQLHSEPAGPEALARNAVLAALALPVAIASSPGGLPGGFWGLSGVQVALVVASVLALVLAVYSAHLSAARRALAGDLERVLAAARKPGLPRGSEAPDFELDAVAGKAQTLSELVANGRPVILLFFSTECGPCLQLLPALGRWQETFAERIALTAIFSGQRDAVERVTGEHGLISALAQQASEVFELYALRATPSAVAIDPSGVITTSAAEGAPAIEALIRTVRPRGTSPVLSVEHVGASARDVAGQDGRRGAPAPAP